MRTIAPCPICRVVAAVAALSATYCTDYDCHDTATCRTSGRSDGGTGKETEETRPDSATSAEVQTSHNSDSAIASSDSLSSVDAHPGPTGEAQLDQTDSAPPEQTVGGSAVDGGASTLDSAATGTISDAGFPELDEGGFGTDMPEPPNTEVEPKTIQVIAGGEHTCALSDEGKVRCWGNNLYGQLGYANTETIGDDELAASGGDVDVGGTVVGLAAGNYHTCALLNDGSVRCWGSGASGQLGYGTVENIGDDETPSSVSPVNVGGTVTALSAGASHTCALLTSGRVRCWGSSTHGQLGYGNSETIGDDESPAIAGDINVGSLVTSLSSGFAHTCALLTNGAVRCWGSGVSGRLGYNNIETIGDDESPASAGDVDVGGTAIGISAGQEHTCALLDDGRVRCWGEGSYGQLGYSDTADMGDDEAPSTAGDVNLGTASKEVRSGGYFTCTLLNDGQVSCWGLGGPGQLGYGNTDSIGDDEHPVAAGTVNLGEGALTLTTNQFHACAVLSSGGVRCWGLGSSGRLGYGNTSIVGDDEEPSALPALTLW